MCVICAVNFSMSVSVEEKNPKPNSETNINT